MGIVDVVEWYESLPADVWNQWVAYDAVEPIGCEWERHASVMAMLETLQAATLNPHLGKEDRMKPRGAEEFLPPGFVGKSKPKKVGLKKQLSIIAKAFGGSWQPQ